MDTGADGRGTGSNEALLAGEEVGLNMDDRVGFLACTLVLGAVAATTGEAGASAAAAAGLSMITEWVETKYFFSLLAAVATEAAATVPGGLLTTAFSNLE